MREPQTRRRVLAAVGTGLTGSVAGCMGAFARDEYDIGMRTQAFAPETLRVDAGTTVVWKNTSTRGHTVTAYENLRGHSARGGSLLRQRRLRERGRRPRGVDQRQRGTGPDQRDLQPHLRDSR